jgi:hypothetical protein
LNLELFNAGTQEVVMQKVKGIVWLTVMSALMHLCLSATAGAAVKMVKGQIIYIPSYSNIISGPPIYMVVPLRSNLIIHNTDPSKPIIIDKIDHYDTDGKLVEKYLKEPLKLNPLGAARVVVKEPKRGEEGLGANFIVQWHADTQVTEPIIDCLMLGTLGNQGFSFSGVGRIIQEQAE